MAERTNITEWRDRPIWQRLLISLPTIGAIVVWVTWIEPRSKYGAITAVAVAVAVFVAWTVRKYRRGGHTREGLWEHTIFAVLFGAALVFQRLGYGGAMPVGALLVAALAWSLVKGHRAWWQRKEAQEARREAHRPAVRLVSGSSTESDAAHGDGPSRVFHAHNDGDGDAFDVFIAYTGPHGRNIARLAGLLEAHTPSEPVRLPPGCTEVALNYWGLPDQRFEQHWRFDANLGWLPSPHATDGPRQIPGEPF